MVKKGLSLEEKQARILKIFHETGDVYVLKVWSFAVTALASGIGVCDSVAG